MRARKYMFIILSLIIALSLLAGCGESADEGAETASPSPTKSAETAGQTPTPSAPTEEPTAVPTEEPQPTEAPGTSAVITVAGSKDNWNVFGSCAFADSDAGISEPIVKVQHIPDPTKETQYDSYASLTFTSDKACSADITLELMCPDAIAGATGYVLEYFVNSYNDDNAYDYLELDYEAEEALNILQTFEITVDLQEGENTLYFVQRTPNNAGGWRINITSATVTPRGDAVISGYTESAAAE